MKVKIFPFSLFRSLLFILFLILSSITLSNCSGGGGGSSDEGGSPTPAIITWVKTFGGNNNDAAYSIQQTSDGGYIVAGESFQDDYSDFWILKLDSHGNIVWQKNYGNSNSYDTAFSIEQTLDGGYIVAGQSLNNPLGEVYILKLNSNGEKEWDTNYSTAASSNAYCIRQTTNGGFIVAGTKDSDVYVLKLSANGNLEWEIKNGGNDRDIGYSIQQTADGGYIVAGETTTAAGDTDFWILKIDDNGNLISGWPKTYGGSGYDIARSIQQTSDGGYIVAGETSSFGAGDTDMWILKLDSSGNIVWRKTFGGSGNERAFSIQQTSDGGYIVAGETTTAAGDTDFWILKLNGNGELIWQKTYGGSGNDTAHSIRQTSDGGYIVAGEKTTAAGDTDFWILKLDENGNLN